MLWVVLLCSLGSLSVPSELEDCDDDRVLCDDGYTYVGRNASDQCEFGFGDCPYVTCSNVHDECPFNVVDCFEDLCDGDKFACPEPFVTPICVANFCGGCHTVCCDESYCDDDTVTCAVSGDVLVRDPYDECRFPTCPGECPANLNLLCPNGYTWLYPDFDDGCQTPSISDCPPRYVPTCANRNDDDCPPGLPDFTDVCFGTPCDNNYDCQDTTHGQCFDNYCGGCHDLCCNVCNDDTLRCVDNDKVVSRNPDNDCQFFSCNICSDDYRLCPEDESKVTRDPENDCNFYPCPDGFLFCDSDTLQCPDGGPVVERDPYSNCGFKACNNSVVACKTFGETALQWLRGTTMA